MVEPTTPPLPELPGNASPHAPSQAMQNAMAAAQAAAQQGQAAQPRIKVNAHIQQEGGKFFLVADGLRVGPYPAREMARSPMASQALARAFAERETARQKERVAAMARDMDAQQNGETP
ncbi:hypothetical protein E3E12_02540 [Formicincola oecophyllae]|uniref:Uncharacterized protein n=1 Tax=Formicincola oecophyllae TaxID=2558361 RepID=A0A4Y6U7Y2_9PROT|nr:hypothetical protein [Formicincola oecophyllae]QDH13264.1 hypothetical protein E3E12_02540 [Formicincola oecophyllae]